MKVDITQIVLGIIRLGFIVFCYYILPTIKQWIISKIGEAKYLKLVNDIETFVEAAEQIAKRDGYDHVWKKAHVVEQLEKLGYTVDSTVDDYIEAAVHALHNELISVGE